MIDINSVLDAKRISSQLSLAVTKLIHELQEEGSVYILFEENMESFVNSIYARFTDILTFEILCLPEMAKPINSELSDLRKMYIEKQAVFINPTKIVENAEFDVRFSFSAGTEPHTYETTKFVAKLVVICEIEEPKC